MSSFELLAILQNSSFVSCLGKTTDKDGFFLISNAIFLNSETILFNSVASVLPPAVDISSFSAAFLI